jgi:hypothetical protein
MEQVLDLLEPGDSIMEQALQAQAQVRSLLSFFLPSRVVWGEKIFYFFSLFMVPSSLKSNSCEITHGHYSHFYRATNLPSDQANAMKNNPAGKQGRLNNAKPGRATLKVREHPTKGVYVEGLTEINVRNAQEVQVRDRLPLQREFDFSTSWYCIAPLLWLYIKCNCIFSSVVLCFHPSPTVDHNYGGECKKNHGSDTDECRLLSKPRYFRYQPKARKVAPICG